MREIDCIACAGAVDVVAFLIRRQAVVAGVVYPLKRKRGSPFIAFGGMFVDYVEDHFDPVRETDSISLNSLTGDECRYRGSGAKNPNELYPPKLPSPLSTK